MKRLLLVASLFSMTYFASAQCTSVGYSPTGIRDDFNGAEPGSATGQGVYAWGEPTLGGDANPGFQAVVDRNTGTPGKLAVTVTQAQNGYVPFGLGFGDTNGDGTGTPYTIDLSGDATFSVKVTNNGDPLNSDPAVKFRLTIQDVNGNSIDTDPKYQGDVFSNAWKYTNEIFLDPGETQTFTVGSPNSASTALSGTFTGGAYADYGTSTYNTNFDFTKVQSILFTVVNKSNTGSPNYEPLAITDVPILIDEIQVGGCPTAIAKAIGKSNTSIAPNPASSNAVMSYSVNSANVVVNVTDMVGNVVKSVEGSNTTANVDVTGLTKGIYFATLVVDGTPVSVEKLVVE